MQVVNIHEAKTHLSRLVERGNPRADAQPFHNFAKIPRQFALPAERIDAARERRRDQLLETFHLPDASIGGRRREIREGGHAVRIGQM